MDWEFFLRIDRRNDSGKVEIDWAHPTCFSHFDAVKHLRILERTDHWSYIWKWDEGTLCGSRLLAVLRFIKYWVTDFVWRLCVGLLPRLDVLKEAHFDVAGLLHRLVHFLFSSSFFNKMNAFVNWSLVVYLLILLFQFRARIRSGYRDEVGEWLLVMGVDWWLMI